MKNEKPLEENEVEKKKSLEDALKEKLTREDYERFENDSMEGEITYNG